MKFYMDFEATRFSNQIIDIGCLAENGNSFHSLVKPGDKKGKVDRFITELTGITNEMLADAPAADQAFIDLYKFVKQNQIFADDDTPEYIFYGNSDKAFINSTIKYMSDFEAITFAKSIIGSYVDYSEEVRKFFKSDKPFPLRNVYKLISISELINDEPKHSALEDSAMLRYINDELEKKCSPEDVVLLKSLPTPKKPVLVSDLEQKTKMPEIYLSWGENHYKKWESVTGADGNNYFIKATAISGDNIMYFPNMEVAVLWVVKYITNKSPKDEKHLKNVEEKIKKALKDNSIKYNMTWEEKNND